MEFINLIIDKIEDIYIFNLVESEYPSRYLHYKNKISDSFIHHFLNEIYNINDYILSLGLQSENYTYWNAIEKLKKVSEVFFYQFIPDEIKERMILADEGYLFLHIDSSLSFIPWELLFDGKVFIGDKFRIGRNIGSHWSKIEIIEKSKLKILVIANPTKDLPEAEEEGNALVEMLSTEISQDYFELQFYSGDRIHKLKFLSEIHEYDIIHYAGHVIYNQEFPEGALLFSHNETLSSIEIKKIKSSPTLIFLNACKSAIIESNTGIANAFLNAKTACYIGTNWNIPDSKKAIDFALNFYKYLFDEKPVGDSLFYSRQLSRENQEIYDLIWASYVLHGNPALKIFKYPEKKTYEAFRSDWNLKKIYSEFPTFIAIPYYEFNKNQDKSWLLEIYQKFFFVLSILIIEYYRYLGLEFESLSEKLLKSEIIDYIQNSIKEEKVFELKDYFFLAYLCARRINFINLNTPFSPLIKNFLLYKEDMDKIISFVEDLNETKIQKIPDEEALMVTLQYLLENLFIDFSFISKIDIFYNNGIQNPSILFKGQFGKQQRILPVFREDLTLKKFVKDHVGEICLIYHSIYLSLDKYIKYDPASGSFQFFVL